MEKHTPGPWQAVDDYGTWEIESASSAIATVNHNRPQHEANARIIAAAPELLEALQSSTAALMDFQREAGGVGILPKLDWQILENLQLIARATGEVAS